MSDAQPAPVPKDAATVVLLRDGDGGPEILMVRRMKSSSFMGDAYVFPGGRLDPADESSHPLHGEGALAADPRLPQMAGDLDRAISCAVGGVRELWEEAGVLLAADEAGALVRSDGDPWFDEARRAVHDGTRGFREVLAERDFAVAVDQLCFFARWVTPVTEPRRFDARFYLARMPAGQTAAYAIDELVEQRWARPQALLDENARGTIKLPPPTLWHLADLAAHRTASEALAWARARAVAVVRPKLVTVDGAPTILLPWDPAYGDHPGDSEVIARDHPVAQSRAPTTRFVRVDGQWTPRAA